MNNFHPGQVIGQRFSAPLAACMTGDLDFRLGNLHIRRLGHIEQGQLDLVVNNRSFFARAAEQQGPQMADLLVQDAGFPVMALKDLKQDLLELFAVFG